MAHNEYDSLALIAAQLSLLRIQKKIHCLTPNGNHKLVIYSLPQHLVTCHLLFSRIPVHPVQPFYQGDSL